MITFTIQVGMISATSKKHEHEQEQILSIRSEEVQSSSHKIKSTTTETTI